MAFKEKCLCDNAIKALNRISPVQPYA